MNVDSFLIFEAVAAGVFGIVLIALLAVSIHACVQRSSRMRERRCDCEELKDMIAEKEQKLNWLTGVPELANDTDLFADDGASNGSRMSRSTRR